MTIQPTVFHITHHKAGSQWVAEVLKHSALERIVPLQDRFAHFFQQPIKPGGVYLAVYITKPEFEAIVVPMHYPYRKFIVIRDLRDTLVSLYFSWKNSHAITCNWQAKGREILKNVDQEQGLLYLIGQQDISRDLQQFNLLSFKQRYEYADIFGESAWKTLMGTIADYLANIQISWFHDDDILLIRYEDLVTDEYGVFERIIQYCQIDVDPQHLHNIIMHNTFEAVTGRKPGQEDVTAHQRKGIVGDWRNYFSERVKDAFKNRFGNVLIQTGYERDVNW